MNFYKHKEALLNEAKKLKYQVHFSTSERSSKACHHPYYTVFINGKENYNTIYSFAHEVGHCIDFKKGNLDFDRYRKDKYYRLKKELIAWWYALTLCIKLDIPLHKFIPRAAFCLKSYLK
jgi:hypothetical protein